MVALANALFSISRLGASIALVLTVVVVVSEIVSRNAFGVSLQLSEEMAGYFLVAFCFLGFTASYRAGDLMKIEMIYGLLPEQCRRVVDVLFDASALLAIAIVDYFAARFVWSSYSRGTVAPTLLQTPQWIPQLFIPIGLTVLALALLMRVIEGVAKMRRGD
ncbi:MAG: TRAP transporter small permease [Pseudorhodoplanes sp.]|nr:TRAP transporter small permease [Pseudorhodoplanes sp.]